MRLPNNIAELSTNNRHNLLLAIVSHKLLTYDEVVLAVQTLFPKFDNTGIYDDYIDDFTIEQYAHSRGLGMSISKAANVAETPDVIMLRALSGEGLSLERFTALIEAELYTTAQLEKTARSTIFDRAESQELKAATEFMAMIVDQDDTHNDGAISDINVNITVVQGHEQPG